ncbi:hypothetical protein GCM10007377_07090 [Galliscardovia ingluviei]|uniref:Uncharacterized protein n=1 Tax=Galliscardovia ingluviei TaxID=1769422 RepID=A0A8J3AH22_9BIFI|nr:hypothetical protein GCM10007377_07090 [Galliscardovia ingluviei]
MVYEESYTAATIDAREPRQATAPNTSVNMAYHKYACTTYRSICRSLCDGMARTLAINDYDGAKLLSHCFDTYCKSTQAATDTIHARAICTWTINRSIVPKHNCTITKRKLWFHR